MDINYIKILFFDSSAILSWFLEQDGASVMEDIFHRQLRDPMWSLNISDTVKEEVNHKLKIHCVYNLPRYNKFQGYLESFYHAGNISRNEGVVEECKSELIKEYEKLGRKNNSQDLSILSEFISYLGFFAGPSHPILISCDNMMNEIGSKVGYRVFDPRKQKMQEIEAF